MAHYATSVRTARPLDEVFAYLADLRNFAAWDPGVRRVVQVEGSGGGPGTAFDVTVPGVAGKELTLRYRTVNYERDALVLVEASSRLFTSIDRITVVRDGDSTIATYDATLRLNGPFGVADALLRPVFTRIGDRAAAGLRLALGGAAA